MAHNLTKLKEVVSHLAFDIQALMNYLRKQLGIKALAYTVMQYEGGQSNPTYLVEIDGEKFVLRRKPPGVLLPSAHAVDREYRVMKALKDTDVPVPEMILLCEDPSIVGTEFYLMKHVEGRVFETPLGESIGPQERSDIYYEMIRVLACLHKVDFQKVGLSDYGKTEDYVARQVHRWSKQYVGSETQKIEAMDKLIEYLPLHLPIAGSAGIVHGDYRLGNVIFHPTKPQIVAVLDWEISTLGDPVSDLAYMCQPFHTSPPQGFVGIDAKVVGIPMEKELFDLYFKLMGRKSLSPHEWNFYLAFNLFRMAAILQGVYARALQGNASSETAITYGKMVPLYADIAWKLISGR